MGVGAEVEVGVGAFVGLGDGSGVEAGEVETAATGWAGCGQVFSCASRRNPGQSAASSPKANPADGLFRAGMIISRKAGG